MYNTNNLDRPLEVVVLSATEDRFTEHDFDILSVSPKTRAWNSVEAYLRRVAMNGSSDA